MGYKNYLQELVAAGDIAPVDSKINMVRRQKGKKCKKHKRLNCQECQKD